MLDLKVELYIAAHVNTFSLGFVYLENPKEKVFICMQSPENYVFKVVLVTMCL